MDLLTDVKSMDHAHFLYFHLMQHSEMTDNSTSTFC